MAAGLRILVANEPRAHREAHGGVLREHFPLAEISIVDPLELGSDLEPFAPDLVICSDLTEPVRQHAFAWILLYPDLADLAVTSIAGQQSVVQGVSIEYLLEAVRETERQRAQSEQAPLRAVAEPPARYTVDASTCWGVSDR